MKQKNVLLGFVIALMPMTANAQVTIEDITYRYYDEGDYIANEAWVTGVDKGKENEVVIPATIIPDETEYTMTIIDENAFQDCSKIKSVVLPAGILVIREDAFSRCEGLKDLTVMSPQPPRLSSDAFDKTAYSTVTIHVPAEALTAYQTDDAWKNFEAIVAYDSSVLPINEATFPDANFRSYISSAIDVNADGWLSREEMMVVGRIDVRKSEVKSLKGIENFTELYLLICYNNELTELDLSKNTKLQKVSCHRNQIAGQAMDNLIASLPNQENGGIALFNTDYIAEEGNVCTTTQVAALKTKGWTAYHLYNDEFVPYPGSEDTAIDGIRLDNSKGGRAYSLSGQRSRNTHKGVVIRNGKKYINK